MLPPMRRLSILLLAGLTACGGSPKRHADADFEPSNPPAHLADLPDPVPRAEPRSRYGNPETYEVFGRTYRVSSSAEGYRERGRASWYGGKFHERLTSSREPFDMYQLTAAHRSLPLPTYVRVTHLGNGRSVIVRVNDRGPFNERRIIDLSYAAAVRLDMVDEGEAEVEVVALTPGSDTGGDAAAVIANAAPPPPRYFESERYDDPVTAIAYREALTAAGVTSVEIRVSHEMGAWHRLRIGPLANAVAAEAAENQLRALGIVYRPVD